MKTNKIWNLWMMLIMALVMVSCGSDDEKQGDGGDGEGGTTVTTEYIATKEIKEVNLSLNGDWNKAYCYVYVGFGYKYALNLRDGKLCLEPFYRKNGNWTIDFNLSSPESYHQIVYMQDKGKLNGITDITSKEFNHCYCALEAKPQHGYAVKFMFEDDEWKDLRVYIKGYTLDDKGGLSSITVQYQLY